MTPTTIRGDRWAPTERAGRRRPEPAPVRGRPARPATRPPRAPPGHPDRPAAPPPAEPPRPLEPPARPAAPRRADRLGPDRRGHRLRGAALRAHRRQRPGRGLPPAGAAVDHHHPATPEAAVPRAASRASPHRACSPSGAARAAATTAKARPRPIPRCCGATRASSGGMCSQSTVGQETKVWCGSGWTGQPSVFERDGRTWVVFGAYDRAIHFVDYDTGEDIIPPFPTGDIIKGSVTIDPDGMPLVYSGSRDNKLHVVAFDRPEPTGSWSLDPNGQPHQVERRLGRLAADHRRLPLRGRRELAVPRGQAQPDDRRQRPGAGQPQPGVQHAGLGRRADQLAEHPETTTCRSRTRSPTATASSTSPTRAGWCRAGTYPGLRHGVEPTRVFRYWGRRRHRRLGGDRRGGGSCTSGWRTSRQRPRRRGGPADQARPRQPDNPLGGRSGPRRLLDHPGAVQGRGHRRLRRGGTVYAVDQATGGALDVLAPGATWQSAVIVGDTLIQGDCEGGLHGYDVSDTTVAPTELWTVQLEGCIESTPAVWDGRISSAPAAAASTPSATPADLRFPAAGLLSSIRAHALLGSRRPHGRGAGRRRHATDGPARPPGRYVGQGRLQPPGPVRVLHRAGGRAAPGGLRDPGSAGRGRSITTLDGLPASGTAWGEAFCSTGASQCGFCTPGIIMRLAGLASRPDAAQPAVEQALLAHLCRCTGWRTILDAWSAHACDAPGACAISPPPATGDDRGPLTAAGGPGRGAGPRRLRRRHRPGRRPGRRARHPGRVGGGRDAGRGPGGGGQGAGSAHHRRACGTPRPPTGRLGRDPAHHVGRAGLPGD